MGEAKAIAKIGLVLQAKGEGYKAVGFHARALAMFAQLGVPFKLGIYEGYLSNCLRVMGRHEFVAACEKAGMTSEDAGKLADSLAKQQPVGPPAVSR